MASTSTGEWVIARVGGAPVVISPTSLLLGLLIAGLVMRKWRFRVSYWV